MIAELGHFALSVTLIVTLLQSSLPLIGAAHQNKRLMTFANSAAITQLAFVTLAFGCLTIAFIGSDFSLEIVAANSHTAKPLLYKISGVWGNHEGSMLLWLLILSLFGASVALFGQALPATLRARVLAIQGLIGLGFVAFILFTSNPFTRLDPAPLDGAGLNPLLQDPGLAFHPPFLYLGYVGFSMPFSFSVAALIEGRVDAAWARWVRPWVLSAWCFLTIGITLGSYWAYYELGWGGWWFWDPVENASFMPWLLGTALLHSALVVERRHTLVNWTILLGILTFSLSIIGTFLVRSGVLTSVHAFAVDPARGVFILGLIVAMSGGAMVLYALRAPSLKSGAPFSYISREGSLVFNNIFLVCAAATVFMGTFYPLIIDAMGNDKISVGPPYFHRTFVPIMIPVLFAMAVGPLLKWRSDRIWPALVTLKLAAGAAMLTAIGLIAFGASSFFSAIGFGLSIWLIIGSLIVLGQRLKLGQRNWAGSLTLARVLPRSTYGLVTAHAGMGLAIAGITGMMAWQSEKILVMNIGESATVGNYEFVLRDVKARLGENYQAETAIVDVRKNNRSITTLSTERRFYPVRQSQTTEAGIRTNWASNLYIAIGEGNRQTGWTMRLYHHPLVPWIWIGALVMAFGGMLSLTDRRFRIGAPQRVAKTSTSIPQPAE